MDKRRLVPFEVAAVIAAACVPLPVPRVVPLLAVATASRWLRGRAWSEVVRGPALYAAVGAAAGVVALAVALVLGAPVVGALTGRGVEWSTFPIVRGSASQLFVVVVLVGVAAVAAELVLRGWLVERVLELGGGPVPAILVGAFAEALITDGELAVRIGAGAIGIALGWMYVAGGRSVIGPTCARLGFALGALLLEALRVVG